MNLCLKNKIRILTDFKSSLEMFNLDKKNILKIKKKFENNIRFELIDIKKLKKKYNAEIYWGTRINDNIINRITNLKWIHFGSVGVDKIDCQIAKKRKIIITNSKKINTDVMLNLVIYYLIDTSKKIIFLGKKKTRTEYESLFLNSKDLSKQKICILGYGQISKKIKNYLKYLGVNYCYFSRRAFESKKIINKKQLMNTLHNFDTVINLLKSDKKNLNFFKYEII